MRSSLFSIQMLNFSFVVDDREKTMKKASVHDRISFQIVFGHVHVEECQIFIY